MQNRIEKAIELAAPVARVWRALSDPAEFGQWFRVDIDDPFVVGEVCRGRTTFPGYEGLPWEVTIVAIEPERRFAFEWRPYAHDPDVDYSQDPQTLVEFRLEPTADGTRLTITESGFAALPDEPRRVDALRSNTEGWNIQARHLAEHVAA
jgi:uncharacterized protein YndB with AHSA1/START domain